MSGFIGVKVCETCHALVNAEASDVHAEWHAAQTALILRLIRESEACA